MEANGNQIVIYQTADGQTHIDVRMENEMVWLSANQIAVLFDRDEKTIRKHVNNVFAENELEQMNNTHFLRVDGVKQQVAFYSLDVIISVGYRVKSQRGTQFRIWANRVLKDYLIKGYAVNERRLKELNQTIEVMKRIGNQLNTKQVLSVVQQYTNALDMLDNYDHQSINKPEGKRNSYVLSIDECRHFIASMKFAKESELFGNEKDGSFDGSIGAIYQTFGGEDVYPSVQEKAANLLYFVTKNHSFSDGNKRIAAALFLYFLDKNECLLRNGRKIISDETLVAMTLMIAESRTEEKELMVNIVMQFLTNGGQE
ncbi:MAG: virulence protein RhuM/Fic/DOC family protein [Marinilabiliaceae bacterium]|nr:virulence protein RhuM/Fic/DOC family protein [Marinilabiliaceae bacterium]